MRAERIIAGALGDASRRGNRSRRGAEASRKAGPNPLVTAAKTADFVKRLASTAPFAAERPRRSRRWADPALRRSSEKFRLNSGFRRLPPAKGTVLASILQITADRSNSARA